MFVCLTVHRYKNIWRLFWIKQSQATNKVKRSCVSGQKHDNKKKIMSILEDPN